MQRIGFGLAAALCLAISTSVAAFDEGDAKKLAKKSGCLKCHSIDKQKDAPSLTEISSKLKGKADAKDELFKHLTTNPMVKVDGREERHESLKTDDEAEIRNVVDWILSL